MLPLEMSAFGRKAGIGYRQHPGATCGPWLSVAKAAPLDLI
jgi:hypothetical protein